MVDIFGQITFNKKDGKITFDTEFEKNFENKISRIDDYVVVRILEKKY